MDPATDVLVVGAGPTGLALAAQLRAFGARVRLVDRAVDRVHESRALAVQPRTLEVLSRFRVSRSGVAETLVARGNRAVRLRIAAGDRVVRARLFDIGVDDTAFPFLLFVSQAETEAVLAEHLATEGVRVERGVEFLGYEAADGRLACRLRHPDGGEEVVRPRYLAGCDGALSTVRETAGIPFQGGRYPQTFLLADLDVEGLEEGAINAFLTERGPLLFFPLGRPAPWRVIAMRPRAFAGEPEVLADLRRLTDDATGGRVRLGDPVWATAFRLHHRQTTRYRAGPVFLAGDAAHIHSPVGAQGMNTGIQDACNLGWKLALVCRGASPESLLDSYDQERRPVGAYVVRFTDRGFNAATSSNPVVRLVRLRVLPRVLPWALRVRAGRAAVFRVTSQLGIRYRRSVAVTPGPRRRRGPRAGDRVPDVRLVRDGAPMWLQEALVAPTFHLLLCGAKAWDADAVRALSERRGELLTVHRLDRRPGAGVLMDEDGSALRRLGVRGSAVLVVRPDGHIGQRSDGPGLADAERYLARWLLG